VFPSDIADGMDIVRFRKESDEIENDPDFVIKYILYDFWSDFFYDSNLCACFVSVGLSAGVWVVKCSIFWVDLLDEADADEVFII